MYYFEIQIVLPEEDTFTFKGRKLSKEELSEVTKYLEDKTSKGIPVKLRVGIFQKDEDIKIMSVTLSTKNTKETNIVRLLINRVTEPNILAFLSTDKQLNEKDEKKEIETNDNIVSPKEEVTYLKNQLSTKRNNKINFRTAILALIIVLLVGGNLIQQIKIRTLNSNIEHLENKINQVKEMDINQAKIDTFGRYFLTYYFAQNKTDESYQSDLSVYVSAKAHLNEWKVLNKTLKSINYYGSSLTGKSTYKVTYVLNVLTDQRVRLQKISFVLKITNKGFKVVQKPKLTDFSF